MTKNDNPKVTINVLIASHNRSNLTLSSIENAIKFCPSDVNLEIFLLDDGSTDDTVDLVSSSFPEVKILVGDGTWYWAKSMSFIDELSARELRDVLWLNDDVQLLPDTISRLVDYSSANSESIVIGQCYSEVSGLITYGGLRRHVRHPFKFFLLEATGEAIECDTFNGNIVFIPKKIREAVGSIDGKFGHRFADIDYGLRSSSKGFTNIVLPGVAGYCERNTFVSSPNPLIRFREVRSKKNLPFYSLSRFAKKHAGPSAMFYIMIPYIKTLLGIKQREISKEKS
jgi:GT2 family glycosyltransferase